MSHATAAVLPERESGTYRMGVLVGHRDGLGAFENEKYIDSA